MIRTLCVASLLLVCVVGCGCAFADGAWSEVQFVSIGSPVVGLHESEGEFYAGVPESGNQAGAVLRLGRRSGEYQLLVGPSPSQAIQGAHFGAALRVRGDLAVVGGGPAGLFTVQKGFIGNREPGVKGRRQRLID